MAFKVYFMKKEKSRKKDINQSLWEAFVVKNNIKKKILARPALI